MLEMMGANEYVSNNVEMRQEKVEGEWIEAARLMCFKVDAAIMLIDMMKDPHHAYLRRRRALFEEIQGETRNRRRTEVLSPV